MEIIGLSMFLKSAQESYVKLIKVTSKFSSSTHIIERHLIILINCPIEPLFSYFLVVSVLSINILNY